MQHFPVSVISREKKRKRLNILNLFPERFCQVLVVCDLTYTGISHVSFLDLGLCNGSMVCTGHFDHPCRAHHRNWIFGKVSKHLFLFAKNWNLWKRNWKEMMGCCKMLYEWVTVDKPWSANKRDFLGQSSRKYCSDAKHVKAPTALEDIQRWEPIFVWLSMHNKWQELCHVNVVHTPSKHYSNMS